MSVSRVQHSASSGSSYQMRTSLPLHTFIRAAEEANDTPSVICHIDPAKAQRCSWGLFFPIIRDVQVDSSIQGQ